MRVITIARKPVDSTLVESVTVNGTGALNIHNARFGPGRYPANLVLQGVEVSTELDAQGEARGAHYAGHQINPRASKEKRAAFGNFGTKHVWRFDDEGGVSRFFKRF